MKLCSIVGFAVCIVEATYSSTLDEVVHAPSIARWYPGLYMDSAAATHVIFPSLTFESKAVSRTNIDERRGACTERTPSLFRGNHTCSRVSRSQGSCTYDNCFLQVEDQRGTFLLTVRLFTGYRLLTKKKSGTPHKRQPPLRPSTSAQRRAWFSRRPGQRIPHAGLANTRRLVTRVGNHEPTSESCLFRSS